MGRDSCTLRQLLCSILFLNFVLALLAGSCWWLLRTGVSAEHLAVAGIEVRQMSLRLDRGLVLGIRRLDIAGGEESSSPPGWETPLALLKRWGFLIQEVEIGALTFRGHTAAVTYRQGLLHARAEQFSVDAALGYSGGTLLLNLHDLRLAPWQLTVAGQAAYDIADDRLLFTGRFAHPLGRGKFWLRQQAEQVEAAISSDEFKELAPVLALFPLDPEAVTWVRDNITASSYRIRDLRFRINLREPAGFGPNDIGGTATAGAVAIRFHPDLEPVRCERVHITFAGDRLSFALDNPVYKGKSLQGSSVYIDNLIGEGSTLGIDLLARTAKDKIVDGILDAYDINFPARQTSGTSRVALRLLFDLSDFSMAVGGMVDSGPGTWLWRDTPLRTGGASVQILNNLLRIDDTELAVGEDFRARLAGFFDAAALRGDLRCAVEALKLPVAGTPLLEAAGAEVQLLVDVFGDDLLFTMPELRTTLRLGREGADIDLADLRALVPLVPLLRQLDFSDGRLRLSVLDQDNIGFAGEIDIPGTFLSLQDQPVSRFRFQGRRTPERTDLTVNDNSIIATWTDELAVNLKGYRLDIDTDSFAGGRDPSSPIPVRVTGMGSLLKVKGKEIPTASFELRLRDRDLSFSAGLAKGSFVYAAAAGEKSFIGRGLDAALVGDFMKNADLTDGTMNVFLKGGADDFEGYLEMNNILIRDTKILNNILAFLNAVPALATFSSPGFDPDGYRVKEGVMYLHYRDRILTIDELRTDGVTINTEARGWINNGDRTLQLTMELITLKDYSRILEKIPLAGYAILGENGTLSTSLDISGSLDHPEIRTNLTQEILMSPINIIKRTIEWPFRLFGQISGNGGTDPEPEIQPREGLPHGNQ